MTKVLPLKEEQALLYASLKEEIERTSSIIKSYEPFFHSLFSKKEVGGINELIKDKKKTHFEKYIATVDLLKRMMPSITRKHKETMLHFYNDFKEDIDLLLTSNYKLIKILNHKNKVTQEINKISQEQYLVLKCICAWAQHLYIRDKRSARELCMYMVTGWAFENWIVNTINTLNGHKCILSAGDKDRKIQYFSFTSTPDLNINGKLVELQQGNNCFFKENKINEALKKDGYILFLYKRLEQYHLFKRDEVEKINASPLVIQYDFKRGRNFKENDYLFSSLEEQLEIIK